MRTSCVHRRVRAGVRGGGGRAGPRYRTDVVLMVKGSAVFWVSSSVPRRYRILVPESE